MAQLINAPIPTPSVTLFYHRVCFELSREIRHESHPQNPLTLLCCPSYEDSWFTCNAYGNYGWHCFHIQLLHLPIWPPCPVCYLLWNHEIYIVTILNTSTSLTKRKRCTRLIFFVAYVITVALIAAGSTTVWIMIMLWIQNLLLSSDSLVVKIAQSQMTNSSASNANKLSRCTINDDQLWRKVGEVLGLREPLYLSFELNVHLMYQELAAVFVILLSSIAICLAL